MSKVTISVFVHLIFSSISCAKYKTICNLIKINVYLSFLFIYSFYFILYISFFIFLFFIFLFFLFILFIYLFIFFYYYTFCICLVIQLHLTQSCLGVMSLFAIQSYASYYIDQSDNSYWCAKGTFSLKNTLINRLLALNLNIKESQCLKWMVAQSPNATNILFGRPKAAPN